MNMWIIAPPFPLYKYNQNEYTTFCFRAISAPLANSTGFNIIIK